MQYRGYVRIKSGYSTRVNDWSIFEVFDCPEYGVSKIRVVIIMKVLNYYKNEGEMTELVVQWTVGLPSTYILYACFINLL